VHAPASVGVRVSQRGGAAGGVPDGPVDDDGHGEVPGPVEPGASEPEPPGVYHERVGAGGGVGQERGFLGMAAAATVIAKAPEVVGVEPQGDIALAAAVGTNPAGLAPTAGTWTCTP
jgi:hypothetical protein